MKVSSLYVLYFIYTKISNDNNNNINKTTTKITEEEEKKKWTTIDLTSGLCYDSRSEIKAK